MKIDSKKINKVLFSTVTSKEEFASQIGLGVRQFYYILKNGSTTEERAFIIESAIEGLQAGSEGLRNDKLEGLK